MKNTLRHLYRTISDNNKLQSLSYSKHKGSIKLHISDYGLHRNLHIEVPESEIKRIFEEIILSISTEDFVDKLIEICEKKNITNTKAASLLGIPRETFSQWRRRKKKPNISSMEINNILYILENYVEN